jgi:hypothetical protein
VTRILLALALALAGCPDRGLPAAPAVAPPPDRPPSPPKCPPPPDLG